MHRHNVGSIAWHGCTYTFELRRGRIPHRAGTRVALAFPTQRKPPRTTTERRSLISGTNAEGRLISFGSVRTHLDHAPILEHCSAPSRCFPCDDFGLISTVGLRTD